MENKYSRPKYRPDQKVTWHNGIEQGKIEVVSPNEIVVNWEGAGLITHDLSVADLYIK